MDTFLYRDMNKVLIYNCLIMLEDINEVSINITTAILVNDNDNDNKMITIAVIIFISFLNIERGLFNFSLSFLFYSTDTT